MFKLQAHGQSKLAGAVVVSALFLSLSAHAGLLGVGGMATGAISAGVASTNAAAQAAGQARAQGVFAAPPALAVAAPVSQTSQISTREAAVVNTGDDVTVQAERATRESHAASTESAKLGTQAGGTATAGVNASALGGARASTEGASVSGHASAGSAVSLAQ